jgi:hypothetical protein
MPAGNAACTTLSRHSARVRTVLGREAGIGGVAREPVLVPARPVHTAGCGGRRAVHDRPVIHTGRSVGFTGYIGGVAVFDRALTPKQMERLAGVGKGGPIRDK